MLILNITCEQLNDLFLRDVATAVVSVIGGCVFAAVGRTRFGTQTRAGTGSTCIWRQAMHNCLVFEKFEAEWFS
jgi:hypothetical protein